MITKLLVRSVVYSTGTGTQFMLKLIRHYLEVFQTLCSEILKSLQLIHLRVTVKIQCLKMFTLIFNEWLFKWSKIPILLAAALNFFPILRFTNLIFHITTEFRRLARVPSFL